MKKLLGTTLALAMFIPAGANAELLKNLKLSGQLDVTAVSAQNTRDFVTRPDGANGGSGPSVAGITTGNDRLGHAFTRTMLSADWDLLDDVHARVTFVKGATNLTASRTYGSNPESVNDWETNTIVQEASVKIDKLAGLFDTTIGRQYYGEAGDLIVYYGPRDNYGFRTEALDAFRFDWNGEHMSITGLAGRTADGTVGQVGSAATSTDLRGLIVSCKMHEMVKPTLYLYNQQSHATGGAGVTVAGKNTNLYVAGLKAKITVGGLSAHVEGAKNFGDDRASFANSNLGPKSGRFTGWAVLTKVAYKLDLSNVGMIMPWGEFGLGTGDANFAHAGNGDFQAINSDYRPGGIYGRFDQGSASALGGNITSGTNGSAASNGLTNRVIWGVGTKASASAIEKLTLGLGFYRYAFHRVAPKTDGTKVSRNIGSEVDVTLDWKHSENVSLGVTLGQFLPGAHIKDLKGNNAAMNPARLAALDVKIKF